MPVWPNKGHTDETTTVDTSSSPSDKWNEQSPASGAPPTVPDDSEMNTTRVEAVNTPTALFENLDDNLQRAIESLADIIQKYKELDIKKQSEMLSDLEQSLPTDRYTKEQKREAKILAELLKQHNIFFADNEIEKRPWLPYIVFFALLDAVSNQEGITIAMPPQKISEFMKSDKTLGSGEIIRLDWDECLVYVWKSEDRDRCLVLIPPGDTP